MTDILFFFLNSIFLLLIWLFISKKNTYTSFYLGIYHILIAGFFLYYTLNNPSDAPKFFNEGSTYACNLGALKPEDLYYGQELKIQFSNAYFIFCLTGIFKKVFYNYGFVSSIFSFIGFIGINYFYRKAIFFSNSSKFDYKLITFFFFLPSVSFWTSGITKDSLIIFGLSLVFDFILNSNFYKKDLIKFVLGSLIILLIRPYYLVFIAFSLFLSKILFLKKLIFNLKINIKTLIIFISALIMIKPLLSLFSSVISIEDFDDFGIDLLSMRSELSKINAIESGGKFITQTGISKILFILFGPFSKSSLNYIAESITGITAIFLMARILYFSFDAKLKVLNSNLLFLFSIFTIELLKFQYSVFNLGIIVRQRTYLILYLAMFLSYLIWIKKINILKEKSY